MAALRHAARRVCGRVLERPYSALSARALEEEPRRRLLLTRGEMSFGSSYRRFSCFSAASAGPPTNHREPRLLPGLVHGKMPPQPSVYRLYASSSASHPPNDKCNTASAVSQVNNVDPAVSLEQQIKEKKEELIRLLTLVKQCSQENKELLDLLSKSNTEKSVEDQAIEDYIKRSNKQLAALTVVLFLALGAQYVFLFVI